MKKRMLCLMTAALLVLGAPITAFASQTPDPGTPEAQAVNTNAKEWEVRYDGEHLNTEIGGVAQSVDLTMPTQLPGGEFTLTAKLENDYHRKTDWYMSNEILKSLEKSVQTQANGGAYTYVLTYHGPEEEGVVPAPIEIYNSSSVGGTTASQTGEVGLEEIKDLKDYFYLDRLLPGEKAEVRLYVGLDGTTLTNSYQDSMAELQLNFAVEKIREGTNVRRVPMVKYISGFVQTGDNAPVAIYSILAFASAVVLIVIAGRQMIKRRKEKGELQ